jgi:hypothetical protein
MTEATPTTIYYGPREAVLTELSPDYGIYQGKYLIVPSGSAQWDAIGCSNKNELRTGLAELRAYYPEADIIAV